MLPLWKNYPLNFVTIKTKNIEKNSSVNSSQRSVATTSQLSTTSSTMAQVSMSQMKFRMTPYHFSLLRSFKKAIDVTRDQHGERIGSMASSIANFTIQGVCKRATKDIPENFFIRYVDQFCAHQEHQFSQAGILNIHSFTFVCIFIIISKFVSK